MNKVFINKLYNTNKRQLLNKNEQEILSFIIYNINKLDNDQY